MNALLSTPILASYYDGLWTANLAMLCIVAFAIVALIRSQTNKSEGAH